MGSQGVELGDTVGVGSEQVKEEDDTGFGIGEVQFCVGHEVTFADRVEQTTTVLGVVGGDTTV